MVKKDKTYRKNDLKQSKLKSALHTDIREFLKYKAQSSGNKGAKTSVTMSGLILQQAKINSIRRTLDKAPIRLIRDLKKTLKLK